MSRREIGGQAKDRENVLKPGGFMNLVIQEKGKEPFINEVLGVERRPGDSRGQTLLRQFIDSPGAEPGIGAEADVGSVLGGVK